MCHSERFHIVDTASACTADRPLVDLISSWSTGLGIKAKFQHYYFQHLLDRWFFALRTHCPRRLGGRQWPQAFAKCYRSPWDQCLTLPTLCALCTGSLLSPYQCKLQKHYVPSAQHTQL